jgi:alpha-aminoadipic semialdehyde synthase
LIFFGRYAGIAGAVDTLHALGLRLKYEGFETPFLHVKSAHEYEDLAEINDSLRKVGKEIAQDGLPPELTPLVIGIAGYGNVGGGASEIVSILPHEEISAANLLTLTDSGNVRQDAVYTVVFKEEDTVEPATQGFEFSLQDFFDNPGNYTSRFADYLPHLAVLINAIYWQAGNPRLVTKKDLQDLFNREQQPGLRVIGDISCDIEGAIEITVKSTASGAPCYTYDPLDGSVREGCEGEGVVVMAVDNLPCEIPTESSSYFSGILEPYVASIVRADYSRGFDDVNLPPEMKRALILLRGELTPNYRYLEKFLAQA